MQLVSVASSRSLPLLRLPSLSLCSFTVYPLTCVHSISFSPSFLHRLARRCAAEKQERKPGARKKVKYSPGDGERKRERNKLFAVLRGAGNVRPRQDPFNIVAALLARIEACRDESPKETQAIAIVSPSRLARFTGSLSSGPLC